MKFKWIITGLIVQLIATLSFGQTAKTETLVKNVAEQVIRNTQLQLIDVATKQPAMLVNAKYPGNVRVASPNSRWEYVNGVTLLGMLRLSEVTGDTSFRAFSRKNFNFIFSNLPAVQAKFEQHLPTEWEAFFRMQSLDDCGAIAAGLSELNKTEHRADYQAYLNKATNYISHTQLRLKDKTLCRDFPHKNTIWADDLFMSVPFLSRAGSATGDKRYTEDAIRQVENFNRYLYDSASGLYFHGWYSDVNANGVAHWLRCNGWIAMAQADLIAQLKEADPKRQLLISYLQRQITGFSRYQDKTGLWHQIIDKPDSYRETSGTAMFIYAIAKAVNEGWINQSYASIAHLGWEALKLKVTSDGMVEDVCVGTNMADNLAFYYNRPKRLNDNHVTGAFLLAGSEMIKMEKNGK